MNWFKTWVEKKKRRQESPNNIHGKDLAPNPFLQPLNYKKWEIIGNLLEFHETSSMHKQKKPFLEFFYRFSRSTAGVFGFVALALLIILAIFLPFTTKDPNTVNTEKRYLIFFTDGHIFGTDALGRDIWARLWWGLRYSLALAFVATFIQVFVGLAIGIMMGHFRVFDKI